MLNKRKLRTWLEISDKAILHNFNVYKRILGESIDIMPVVKSNAYGHDAVRVAKLLEHKVNHFGVVFLEEALELRKHGIRTPILAFSATLFDTATVIEAIRENISFTVYDKGSYMQLNRIARNIRKKALVHVNIDTGMTRLGFNNHDDYEKTIAGVCANKHLTIQGIYSHLSSADSDVKYTEKQCRIFEEAVAQAEAAHCIMRYKHILNTPGSALGISIGNMARIGRGLYGLQTKGSIEKIQKAFEKQYSFAPALSWKTRVIQVHTTDQHTSIGYGRTYRTRKKSMIATLPVGFADGYPRILSNRGEVLIKGKRCPVRGRVCMNNIMVDVSAGRDIRTGDETVIIGTSGKETITPRDIAEQARTTQSEIVTMIPKHIPRV